MVTARCTSVSDRRGGNETYAGWRALEHPYPLQRSVTGLRSSETMTEAGYVIHNPSFDRLRRDDAETGHSDDRH